MSSRQIDYTSRDYDSLRADMIRIIQARIPSWQADRSDFGTLLVEAIAYGLDTLHYYLDRAANEAYLSTALQRESLYSISEMFQYTPKTASPATVRLAFSNSGIMSVTLPKGTRCQGSVITTYESGESGSVQVNFETQADIEVPPASITQRDTAVYVDAVEGRTYEYESLGISGGEAKQQYRIGRYPVISHSISIFSVLGESSEEWREVLDVSQWGPNDKVFQVITASDGSSSVMFGDGVSGSVPPMYATLKATYRVGGGTIGNVPAGTVVSIVEPVFYGVSVINDAPAVRGTDPESIDSIRVNAARAFRTRDRAVTLADYESVTSNSPWFSKAKAVSGSNASVVVYAVPNDDGSGRPVPNVSLRDTLKNYLESKSMAGVTVTVAPATWVDVYIRIDVVKRPTAVAADIENEISRRLDNLYGYTFVEFGGKVSVADILPALAGIPGVDDVSVTNLSPFVSPEDESYVGPPSTSTVSTSDISDSAIVFYSSAQHLGVNFL